MKKLYTAVATSTGGRGNGAAKTADGMLDLKIGTPKKLGGKDDGVNPEQLFAAGYSTCYLGAIKFVAVKEKKPAAISPDFERHRPRDARRPRRQKRIWHRRET